MNGLRIAITADPELPVPPRQYGGIERIVDLLALGLANRGHDVTLFSHPDSTVAVNRIAWRGGASGSLFSALLNMETLAAAHASKRFDIVHSFSRLAYLTPILPLRVVKVMSYQRQISTYTVSTAMRLARGTLRLVACSRQMIPGNLYSDAWSVIYNSISTSTYRFRSSVPQAAPLVFLGRVEKIKGPHLAIQIARLANRQLILAGNVPCGHEQFFETEIRPHLDADRIKYIGPVDDAEKDRLLGDAAALLMPIVWDEPFGIVMAEALACGTPVVGFARGAIPEVVDHGITGFIGRDLQDLVDGVNRIDTIDRQACRRIAESRFSANVMVDAYLSCYQEAFYRTAHDSQAASDRPGSSPRSKNHFTF